MTWVYNPGNENGILSQDLHDIDGLVQDCSISIANALGILQSCTNQRLNGFPANVLTAMVYMYQAKCLLLITLENG